MNIVVTGGLGLIGHNVVDLLRHQHCVTIIDNQTTYGVIPQPEIDYLMAERWSKINQHAFVSGDIVNAEVVDSVFDRTRPDCVIHMASFPRQKVVNNDPRAGAAVMSGGLINLLESAKSVGCQRFVYISSSMVYGDFEDQVREDAPCAPIGQYGILKLAGEWLVRDYARRTGMESVIIRPSAVYGPLDVEDRVISRFMLTAMRGGQLTVNGPSETLDFTYVTDAAAGIVAAAVTPAAANRTYNITKSHSWSLLRAAELAVAIVGRGTIQCRDRDQDFPSRGALNIDAARRDLGYDPKIDVEQGFQHYYDWLRDSVYWSSQTA